MSKHTAYASPFNLRKSAVPEVEWSLTRRRRESAPTLLLGSMFMCKLSGFSLIGRLDNSSELDLTPVPQRLWGR
jgi:hypothetical protein